MGDTSDRLAWLRTALAAYIAIGASVPPEERQRRRLVLREAAGRAGEPFAGLECEHRDPLSTFPLARRVRGVLFTADERLQPIARRFGIVLEVHAGAFVVVDEWPTEPLRVMRLDELETRAEQVWTLLDLYALVPVPSLDLCSEVMRAWQQQHREDRAWAHLEEPDHG